MTLEECFRICRTAVSDDEVEEALGVLRNFINLALKHSIQFSDFSTLGTLVRQLAIHKDDMDARIPPKGLQWTAGYCEKIEGWIEANSAVEKHKVGEGPHELIEIPGPLPEFIITAGEPLPESLIVNATCTPLSDWVLPHKGTLVHFMRFSIRGTNERGFYATEALEAVVRNSETHPEGVTVQANEFEGEWSVLNATDHLLKELFKE